MEFEDRSHEGKTYIVTGGGSGIGRATAVLLGRRGAKVAIADVDAAAGTRIVESIGATAIFVETDLCSIDSIQALVQQTVARFGTVDGLANVAAVHRGRPFLDTSPEDWEQIEQINHRAVFFLTQAVARVMIERGTRGSIVNFASGAAFRPVPGQAAYSGSKGGVVALTRSMADELNPHGIRVNTLAPGHTASETVVSRMTQEQLDQVAATLVGGRWMTPEEVAEAAVFLLGHLSRGMTGASLNVNLGNYMPH